MRGIPVGVLAKLGALFVPLATAALGAEPIPHGQSKAPGTPLTPAEAIARMTVPPGFQVELVASEPDLVNPVAMAFDERGRIWVTESLEYPRNAPGVGRDRVKVLEDRDGDGKADTFTVFAEGLNIPSGIAVGHGGVWVANAPDILFLRDTDNDGKADQREVVVTGFGRADTHELPNSLTWGPDGWLYGWNGVFNPSKVTHQGKSWQFTCAIFRIHPRTRTFEVFCEGTSNPWGIAWDLEGNAFASACVIDHLWHLSETGYYHRQGGPYPPYTWKIESIVQHRHQQAAYCGIHYFDSDAYPEPYRERLFMGNIHGNAINVDRLERSGSTYVGEAVPDFLAANDAWFMPVSQKTGPDGCLYILDWYDRYHCYQDARRDPEGIDRLKGRLYRVRYRETPRAGAFDLARESDDQLIARLSSANVFYRDQVQRLLAERNRPAANAHLEALALDDANPRKARMHALWARLGAGGPSTDFLGRLLDHPDATFRAWGVRASGNAHVAESVLRQRIAALAADRSADVRLQVAIAARKLEGAAAVRLLLDVLSHSGDDPLIPRIVWQNLHPLLEEHGAEFVRLVGHPAYRGKAGILAILPRAVECMLGEADEEEDVRPVVALVALVASGPDRSSVMVAQHALDTLADQIQSGAVAKPVRKPLKRGLEPVVRPILERADDAPLVLEALTLALAWNDDQARERVSRAFLRTELAPDRRLKALEALVAAEHEPILAPALRVAADAGAGPVEFRIQVLAALGQLETARVAALILERYPDLDARLRDRAVDVLTERPAWSRALLEAIDAGRVSADALNLGHLRKLQASKDAALKALVRARYGTVRKGRSAAREEVIARVRRLLAARSGDPRAGAEVFKKLCAQCHKIHGEGQDVGPDITRNGRGSFDQLLSNVLDPSLVIGNGYQATTVATRDGRVLTGLLAEEGPGRIVLKTQGGKLETIARDEVEELTQSALSLMPEDVEKQLTEAELRDLFSFLSLDRPPNDPEARPIPGAFP